MKGKQMAMDSLLREADWSEKERKIREWAREKEQTDRIVDKLDDRYGRMNMRKLLKEDGYPAGSVVIIGQYLYRNDHYTLHFYRTVLGYHSSVANPKTPHFVEAPDDEWPDVPPWAHTVGHENDARDIGVYSEHMHWATGEVIEPIITWWQKEWKM